MLSWAPSPPLLPGSRTLGFLALPHRIASTHTYRPVLDKRKSHQQTWPRRTAAGTARLRCSSSLKSCRDSACPQACDPHTVSAASGAGCVSRPTLPASYSPSPSLVFPPSFKDRESPHRNQLACWPCLSSRWKIARFKSAHAVSRQSPPHSLGLATTIISPLIRREISSGFGPRIAINIIESRSFHLRRHHHLNSHPTPLCPTTRPGQERDFFFRV